MSSTVHGPRFDDLGQFLDEISDRHTPGGVVEAEEGPRVRHSDVGEVGTSFEGVDPPLLAHGPQQTHRQGTGPDAGLHHDRAREDIGHGDDLTGVLGVDHRGASRHRHHVVRQQGPQREVLDTRRVLDRRPVGRPDEVVVSEATPMRVELLPRPRG